MRLAAFLLLLLLWTWFLLEVAQLNRFQFRILLSPLISVSLFLLPPVVAHQQFRHCCSSCNSAFCWLSTVYVCVCARARLCVVAGFTLIFSVRCAMHSFAVPFSPPQLLLRYYRRPGAFCKCVCLSFSLFYVSFSFFFFAVYQLEKHWAPLCTV